MNVDLRRTLGPGGNQGKKIDYAVSELRTLEVGLEKTDSVRRLR